MKLRKLKKTKAKLAETRPSLSVTARKLLQQGMSLHQAGRLADAEALYRQALASTPSSPDVTHMLGLLYADAGNLPAAEDLLRKSILLAPGRPKFLFNLGVTLMRLEKKDEAAASFEQVCELDKTHFGAFYNLGLLHTDLGDYDKALLAYNGAYRIDPLHPDLLLKLAVLLEKKNDLEGAAKHVNAILARQPNNFKAKQLAALLCRRRGEPRQALSILQEILPEADKASALELHFELGKLHDSLHESEAAFEHFVRANALQEEIEAPPFDKDASPTLFANLSGRFTSDWIASWRPHAKRNDGAQAPVFLVGFPRSGTTLLNQILASHSKIGILEERDTVATLIDRVNANSARYPDALADLSEEQAAELRLLYYDQARQYVDLDRGQLLIDKMPLNMVHAGLIGRIFPAAKFLFALRHPFDAVLSSFMQEFKLNNDMVHFLALKTAASYYRQAMELWLRYVELLPLRIHEVRYENIVDAFDETTGDIFDFLGLAWEDGVRDFAARARQRGFIKTPSYSQITQSIYNDARFRWQRYKVQLQPVETVLQPFAERFGYPT